MTLPAAADPALEPAPARLHWRALLHPGIEALWALAFLSSLYFLLCAWGLPLLPQLGQNRLLLGAEDPGYARLTFSLFALAFMADYPLSWYLVLRAERPGQSPGISPALRRQAALRLRLSLALLALVCAAVLLAMLNGSIAIVRKSF